MVVRKAFPGSPMPEPEPSPSPSPEPGDVWDKLKLFIGRWDKEHKALWARYARTPRYKEMKAKCLARDHHECVICRKRAQVAHHNWYAEVPGTETLEDLASLCNKHHFLVHFPLGEARRELHKKLNPHRMDKQKWRVLDDIAKLNLRGHEWVKVGEGRRLFVDGRHVANTSYCAAVHCRRLKWFGLLESKGHRTGESKVTELGYDFLAGRASVPATIWCRDGRVWERTKGQVVVTDIKGVILDKEYWDCYATIQVTADELMAMRSAGAVMRNPMRARIPVTTEKQKQEWEKRKESP